MHKKMCIILLKQFFSNDIYNKMTIFSCNIIIVIDNLFVSDSYQCI